VAMTARTATAEERARLWPIVEQKYKGYAGYQQRTDREIPLVRLEKSRLRYTAEEQRFPKSLSLFIIENHRL